MAITDKIKTITSFIGNVFRRPSYGGGYYGAPETSITQISKDALIAFIEKYKGVRRIILVVVMWINIHIFLFTMHMYKSNGTVDTQWVIFAGYWAAILATFVGFYTMSRAREFNSYTQYSRPGEWISAQGAGYWASILATFVGFYTMSRAREFSSYTQYSRPGEWISAQGEISTYSATEYTSSDNPSIYNDDVPEYEASDEINGDMMIEGKS